jgi:uncharacterized protein (TIGR03083 family)
VTTLPEPPWDHERVCTLVGEEIQRFADLVQGAPMDAEVPTCPGWDLGKLVRHVGTIHRWAGAMVEVAAPERIDVRTLDLGLPEHPSWLPGWLAAGAEELVARLRRADPEQPMWAWGADQHTRFWPRRMLHETTVHRADAELALGGDPHGTIDPEVAADGIDELFANLPPAVSFSPNVAELKGEGSFGIAAGDTGIEWVVTLRDDGFDARRVGPGEAKEADALLTGFTPELLLVLYRRETIPQVGGTVAGDGELIERFLEHCALL